MRPNTLAEAVERIQAGASQDIMLAEFVDTFNLAPTSAARYATIEEEPALTKASNPSLSAASTRLMSPATLVACIVLRSRWCGYAP